jgi:SSS family solute:Na+ symporter
MMVALFIGLRGYRLTGKGVEEYFLAGRSLGTVVLLFTMFATLMSAFTFFGGPGQVYATGMEWMLTMGIMDGFIVAILWYVVGMRQWRLGRRYGYITLGQMLGSRFGSGSLKAVVSVLSLFWLFPYLMIQQMGAGLALETLTGGYIPYALGAGVITVFMLVYVVLGGMRGVAWTDTFQGLFMMVCIWLALIVIGIHLGGLEQASQRVLQVAPRVFTLGESWTPQMIWSAAAATALGVITFPQVNQRFFVGRSEKVIRRAFILWPVLCLLLFVPTFLVGAWGAGFVSGLPKPDAILSVMLGRYAPFWFASIIVSGALAAMMSSSDSMLLSASSYITNDLYLPALRGEGRTKSAGLVGRVIVAVFAVASYVASLKAPRSLVSIGLVAFGGFAQFTPVLLLSLYWRGTTKQGALTALFVSEAFYIASKFTAVVPASYGGWDSSLVGVALAFCITVGISCLTAHSKHERLSRFFSTP